MRFKSTENNWRSWIWEALFFWMLLSLQEKNPKVLLYYISKSILSSILLHFNTKLNLLAKKKVLQSKLLFCVSDAAPSPLTCHASIYLFRAVWVHSHQKNMMKSCRWTVLQGYNKTGLLGALIFYTENKPKCFLVLRGSKWCLCKLCCKHSKLQGEILTSLRPTGNFEELDGVMISCVMVILRLSALYKTRPLV